MSNLINKDENVIVYYKEKNKKKKESNEKINETYGIECP